MAHASDARAGRRGIRRAIPRGRRVSDWIGFLFFAGLAVWTAVKLPGQALFLGPTFALELLTALTFLLRDRARATAPGTAGRFVAYAGTAGVALFFHAARLWRPEWLALNPSAVQGLAGVAIWLVGSATAIHAVWWLRRSFSIEPEARSLVIAGPYRWARHPIYTGYMMQYAGLWLMYPTPPFALVLIGWLAVTMARIHFEERVLAAAFPEYCRYRQAVAPLGIPRPARVTTRRSA